MVKKFRQKYYDYFSYIYDWFVALHSFARHENLRDFLADKTGLRIGERSLDICTGTGSVLFSLEKRVGKTGMVVGMDFSRGMLKAGRKKTLTYPNIFFIEADVAYLPFKDRIFNAVTCSYAFYELKGQVQSHCLQEIARVLEPAGPFLMMEHDVPKNFLIRMLFYIRLFSMGSERAVEILKHEHKILECYFKSVEEIKSFSGKSKIFICRN